MSVVLDPSRPCPASRELGQKKSLQTRNALNPTHAPLGNPANPISPLSAQLAGLNAATCAVTPASSSFENVFPYLNSASTPFAPVR